MARDPAYDLTDAEKRDLINLIKEGKPLPDKYRFILFHDRREAVKVTDIFGNDTMTLIPITAV